MIKLNKLRYFDVSFRYSRSSWGVLGCLGVIRLTGCTLIGDPRMNYVRSMWEVLHNTFFFPSNFEWNHNGTDQPAWMIFTFVVHLGKRPSVSRKIQIHFIIMNCFCVGLCPLLTPGRWKLSRICFVSLQHAYAIYRYFVLGYSLG